MADYGSFAARLEEMKDFVFEEFRRLIRFYIAGELARGGGGVICFTHHFVQSVDA